MLFKDKSTINNPRSYLTKSKFILGLECPTKLYYHSNSSSYSNQSLNDPFLEALAKGGFQVGALARAYYPAGIIIEDTSNDQALIRTNNLLQQESCVIFEAAVQAEGYFIRVDILVKNGNKIELIEVKAKSFYPNEDQIISNKGKVGSNWQPYIADIAFQEMVIKKAFPEFSINSFLMLADKSKTTTVNGLNQKFRLVNENNRTKVVVAANLKREDLGEQILVKVQVNDAIEKIKETEFNVLDQAYSFENYCTILAESLNSNLKLNQSIGKHCKGCQFDDPENTSLSGFKECWKTQTGLTEEQLKQPLLFELWRGRLGVKDIITPLLDRRDYFLKDYTEADYSPKPEKTCQGFSAQERRTLQIQKAKDLDHTPSYDIEFLKERFESFVYPLHFIDFETTALAIPMYAGIKPYEQIAFQFSHHSVKEDGTVTHETQWLNDEVGVFPNFNFVRALMNALTNDNGSIFRYHNHENTILNCIYQQLMNSQEVDREELCSFIRTITHKKNEWIGERDMIDLYELVLSGFYHPAMKGSNSIKQVLPAAIESSAYLQTKYSKPIYGTSIYPSLNLKDHIWLKQNDNGKWISPYKTLPSIFSGIDSDILDELNIEPGEELSDGGAAMMAYAKMQFTEMSDKERQLYHNALLRYCELDTLAMVMIYEGWKDYLYGN